MGIKNSFFEWMRLWFLNKKETRTLRITGSTSLKHPSGDIDFVEAGKREVVLAINEMSLLGADSPLPDSLLKGVRTGCENSLALAAFLNVLQHHIAMLRFNALMEKSSLLMREAGNLKWQNRFAQYNEVFSLEMLRCCFIKLFPYAQISVHPFEPLRIKNPSPVFLGKTRLNGASLLGESCTSFTHAIRVNVDDIPLDKGIELKKKKFVSNEKFPLKIKVKFSTKTCSLNGQKLSENFWLGSKNFEPLKWEVWL